MPRESIAEFDVERVQVLAADGTVDEDLEPDLSDEQLLALYESMKRSRALDEKGVALQRRGEIGTFAPAVGQEAAQVGSAFALREDDWMVPSFREHPAYLTRGTPIAAILAYTAGMEEGAMIPEGEHNMPPSIAVGAQVPHAAGIGWAQEITDDPAATLVYFGDGASSEGDSYEGMNFAGVFDAHVVFFCQNNQYAISVPRARQTDAETLAQKAIAAGIETVQVDGNDVLGVYSVTADALERARAGDPGMIEAVTYRRSMHTTADDPSVYRDETEEEAWVERDPIDRFERYLTERGVLDDERIAELESEIASDTDEAFAETRELMDALDAADMFEHVYEELTPDLEAQLAAFRRANDGE
ncbi:pyruvate dehydrogenase (acetyl-transferring) E1 component subunit alpha [Halomarina pelagica]|uniref:pyruvate dehydrogenase (acetyl-transferring) E1 component subunit alpha n=1 Tax=Halomarina pelagica TaxID=2961599 RepID=UPI0020C2F08E|nr:pyruvate dehydrogenase (acetyl-transferring) E1 component subunit alpha [Halomarina sp. BND7]